jgi:hypothetical protein
MNTCRFKAVPAKERKSVFNSFCENAVEERRKIEAEASEAAANGVRELLSELLGVMPLQFWLFRDGKSLVEVEIEVAAAEERRKAQMQQFGGDEPEEGEQDEEGEERISGGNASSDAALAKMALSAVQDLEPGGLFVAGMEMEDLEGLVGGDERWLAADEHVRAEVWKEVVGDVLKKRKEEDASVEEAFEARLNVWLTRQGTHAASTWEEVHGDMQGVLALLPERIGRRLFQKYISELKAQEVRQ